MKSDSAFVQFNMLSLERKLQILSDLQEIEPTSFFLNAARDDEDELDEEALSLVSAAGKADFKAFLQKAESHLVNN